MAQVPALPDWWRNRPVKRNTLWYEGQACEAANLPHPDDAAQKSDCAFLGRFIPADSAAIVDRLTRARLKRIRAELSEYEQRQPEALDRVVDRRHVGTRITEHMFMGEQAEDYYENLTLRDQIAARLFYTYAQYLKALRGGTGPRPKEWQRPGRGSGTYKVQQDIKIPVWASQTDRRFAEVLADGYATEDFTPDLEGYVHYLDEIAPEMAALLKRSIPVFLPLKALARSAHILGKIGSGKSELLKLIFAGIARNRQTAVILVDPHGDLIDECVRMKEIDPERLVLIDPHLQEDWTPTVNLLKSPPRGQIDVLAQQITDAFQELLTGARAELSVNQRRILKPCLRVLLEKGDGTLRDLQHMMQHDARADPLINLGKQSAHQPTRDFFAYEFSAKRFDGTKGAIATKLGSIIDGEAEAQLFIGASKIDLEQLINDHKIIAIKASQGLIGPDAAGAFAKLIIAYVQGIAMRRAAEEKAERVPVVVMADECHTFFTASAEELITNSRKYKVALIGANQRVTSLRRDMLGALSLTSLKIAGSNGNSETRRYFADVTNTPLEVVDAVNDYEFLVKIDSGAVFTLYTSDHLIDTTSRVPDAVWAQVQARQLERYYRRIDDTDPKQHEPDKTAPKRQPKYPPPRRNKFPNNRP